MSVSEEFHKMTVEDLKGEIKYLMRRIERLEKEKSDALDKKLKAMEDRERQIAESRQTLYCEWEDTSAFSVPKGIDLRDKKNVKWYVRWGTLHIETRDGQTLEIEATDAPQLKSPEKCSLYDHNDEEEEDNISFNPEFESDSDSESDSESEGEQS